MTPASFHIHKGKKELKLPPHSNEPHPLFNQGEVSKPFLISIISIVAIVLLVIFLFLGKQFVGKAFYVGVENTAGFEDIPSSTIGSSFSGVVRANIGAGQTVAISFQLALPEGVRCTEVGSSLGWSEEMLVLNTAECDGDTVTFEYATLNTDEAMTGDLEVARIWFAGVPAAGTYALDFIDFTILNLDDATEDSIGDGIDAEITVVEPGMEIEGTCSVDDLEYCTTEDLCGTVDGYWDGAKCGLCGNGNLDDGEDCDDANFDGHDLCSSSCQVTSCADGIIQSPNGEGVLEACDDENKVNGDGCSFEISLGGDSVCQVEESYICAGEPSVCVFECETDDECSEGEICEGGGCVSFEPEEEEPSLATGPSELTITSTAFTNGAAIPEDFTCNGRDVSPQLSVINIPEGTQSLAIIMDDPVDAVPYVHWTVLDIPVDAEIEEIPEGIPSAEFTISANEVNGEAQYAGPCPPAGETHTYRFTVYALSTDSVDILTVQGDDAIVRKSVFEAALEGAILRQGTLNGLYYPPPEPSVSGGGGGGGCNSLWSCSPTWGYCNATLQQSRTCTDLNRCDSQKLTKLENRSCTICEESWTCIPWNACQNGQQTRNCVDEHACTTTVQKPALQKSCTQAVAPGPAPVRVQPSSPAPVQQPTVATFPSFWTQYKPYIIGIPIAIIVLVLAGLGAAHFLKPKQVAYNLDDLKEWIRKEQQLGTSNKDIEDILGQHTGWSREEMEKAFQELKGSK